MIVAMTYLSGAVGGEFGSPGLGANTAREVCG
jgi:hypothetical protein